LRSNGTESSTYDEKQSLIYDIGKEQHDAAKAIHRTTTTTTTTVMMAMMTTMIDGGA
jgi:hypothetical protein